MKKEVEFKKKLKEIIENEKKRDVLNFAEITPSGHTICDLEKCKLNQEGYFLALKMIEKKMF